MSSKRKQKAKKRKQGGGAPPREATAAPPARSLRHLGRWLGLVVAVVVVGLVVKACVSNGDNGVSYAPTLGFEVIAEHPHDPGAFTQGLFFHEGHLYEGTGQTGFSTLRKVDLETGVVLRKIDMPDDIFGEGITLFEDRIIQLTWENEKGFVYRLDDFEKIDEFEFSGQGWGLTTDGKRLIMTDGTAFLRFLDPKTYEETGSVLVRDGGVPVADQLNELEFIKGEVWANSWNTDWLLRIDPKNGRVKARIDLRGIRGDFPPPLDEVLNGIAYDPATERLWVTGKNWSKLYQIEVR